jgi:putative ABC transport system substrate-binding protein
MQNWPHIDQGVTVVLQTGELAPSYNGFCYVRWIGMAQEHADALYVGYEVESWMHRRLIVELAEKNRLPAIYSHREHVEDGGLMAYTFDDDELWTRAAGCIAQILNGASPGTFLSIRQRLLINLKAADAIDAIGLTIPPSLLYRANEVIE